MRAFITLFTLTTLTSLTGCAGEEQAPPAATNGPTYYADTKAIVDAKCAGCHQEGDIAPFALTTPDQVQTFSAAMRAAISAGTMPPWQPSDDCNDYKYSIDLTAEEKDTLLAWLDAGAPAGDPAQAPNTPQPDVADGFEPNITLPLPEAYAPTRGPDDYRCQLIPWPETETTYVTGARVTPDKREIVHHVILFVVGPDQVEQFQAFDDAEEGPGYTCYGGPTASDDGGALANVEPAELLAALNRLGLTVADLQSGNLTEEQLISLIGELDIQVGGFGSIGSWVPGVAATSLPAGTGIRVEPGSMIVAQFHYNTLNADAVADRSIIEIETTNAVDRQATILPAVDFGWVSNGLVGEPMTIPAGAAEVEHSTTLAYDSFFMASARQTLGLPDDAPLVIHRAGHHMHELGKRQRTELRHADQSTTCVLDIPDWDFAWQGAYTLESPIVIRPGDELWMGCTWDNSAANQPTVGGAARSPVDVAWGEGTADEMCLGSLYVTGM